MVFGPSRLGLDGAQQVRDARDRTQSAAGSDTDRTLTSIPATPPAEVLDALDTAARVLEELASRRITLHFEYNDAAKQVHIQVVNADDGTVVREIPPGALLELAAGNADVKKAA
jgi:uncharacterized FlaG/YvyC family protein